MSLVVERRALEPELRAQFVAVDEVAVVGEGHAALHMVDDDRLGVVAVIAAGRAVAHMADGDAAGAERVEPVGREDVVDEPHVHIGEQPVAADDDAAGLLPAVLQKKTGRGTSCAPRQLSGLKTPNTPHSS